MPDAGVQPMTAAFPAVPDSVPAARHTVLRYLHEASMPDPPLSDIGLVVSEAVTNVVNHAYTDAAPGEVRLRVELLDSEVEVVVEDDGQGMVPRPDSPGLGLGLPLIASVSERFDTRSTPGQGTTICVWFLRDPSAAALPG